MKSLLVTTLMLASISAIAMIDPDQENQDQTYNWEEGSNASVQLYEGHCHIGRPLYYYENCSRYSELGNLAVECAMDNAFAKCKRSSNLDCVPVTGSEYVWAENVVDFPGAIKCKARVQFRGYKYSN